MSPRGPAAPIALALMWGVAPGAIATQDAAVATVHKDPFERPVLVESTTRTAERRAVSTPTPPPPWEAELRAVLVGGARSLVNVDGTILGIGESIEDHRLVEVHERAAVFVKDGRRETLSLDPPEQ